jgi:hypothetical protein
MRGMTALLLGNWLAILSSSAGANLHGTITPEMRREDPRLERRVSLSNSRITIGNLAVRLGQLTALDLGSEIRDPATGEQIAVFLRDLPIADGMNAIWSLMSYRNAAWEWRGKGSLVGSDTDSPGP